MCLHPASPLPVPDDTAKIARRAFPRGNLLLSLRDKLGPVFDDSRFAYLFPANSPFAKGVLAALNGAERGYEPGFGMSSRPELTR